MALSFEEKIQNILQMDVGMLMCNISLIIMLCLIGYSTYGSVIFRLKHLCPKVTETTTRIINTDKEPIQIDINNFQGKEIIGDRGNKYFIEYMAKYSISGMAVATNTNFWLRGTMRNEFDEVALYDIGLVWGKLANKGLLQNSGIKFKSQKTLGFARQLSWSYSPTFPYGSQYFNNHVSHTHIIPANDNIMSALYKIKKYDKVRFNGYLVDIYDSNSNKFIMTSLSRNDTNLTARGGGACEVMYVTIVQLGNKIYK